MFKLRCPYCDSFLTDENIYDLKEEPIIYLCSNCNNFSKQKNNGIKIALVSIIVYTIVDFLISLLAMIFILPLFKEILGIESPDEIWFSTPIALIMGVLCFKYMLRMTTVTSMGQPK